MALELSPPGDLGLVYTHVSQSLVDTQVCLGLELNQVRLGLEHTHVCLGLGCGREGHGAAEGGGVGRQLELEQGDPEEAGVAADPGPGRASQLALAGCREGREGGR